MSSFKIIYQPINYINYINFIKHLYITLELMFININIS